MKTGLGRRRGLVGFGWRLVTRGWTGPRPSAQQAPRTLGLPFSLPHSPLVGSSSLRRSARPLRSPPADLRAAACGAMPAGGGWPCPPRAARSQPASGLPSPDGSLFPGGQAPRRAAAGPPGASAGQTSRPQCGSAQPLDGAALGLGLLQ